MTKPNQIDFTSRIRVCEGAMGTLLLSSGILAGEDFGELNLTKPDLIGSIHRDYAKAGANCAITNTFSPRAASDKGDAEHLDLQIQAAVDIARGAITPVDEQNIVFGEAGPCGDILEPLGSATFDDVFNIYSAHIDSLAKAGADAILLETFMDIADLRCAIFATRSVCSLPIVASCTFNEASRMPLSGTTPAAASIILDALDVEVIGMNCGIGPDSALAIIKEMREHTNKPLVAQPNAGLPIQDDKGNCIYPGTPEEMAKYALLYADLGATVIGSCCGSDPKFTRAIAQALEGVKPKRYVLQDKAIELASMSNHVSLNPEFFDMLDSDMMEAGAEIIQTDEIDDYFDVLEESATCPLILDFCENLETLEEALKYYPGKAALRGVHGHSSATELAKRYGAYLI